MKTVNKYICTHTYDPCYGLDIIRPGQVIQVQRWDDEPTRVRVVQVGKEKQQGFGWTLSDHDLKAHFKRQEDSKTSGLIKKVMGKLVRQ